MSSEAFFPASLGEALATLAESQAVPIAGGTDLMVRHRRHSPVPITVGAPPMFIGNLAELREISASESELCIGAAVTLSEIASFQQTPTGLRQSIAEFAAPAIRNAGTIGGNICNASPAADTLPFLYSAGASVVLASREGERELSITEFIAGPGATSLKPDELLVLVRVPRREEHFVYYRKVAPRRSNALSKLSLYASACSVAGKPRRAGGFRLALGAVAPTVVRVPEIESMIEGKTADELRNRGPEITEMYREFISPIDDQRSTETYRRNTSLALIRHILGEELPSFLEQS